MLHTAIHELFGLLFWKRHAVPFRIPNDEQTMKPSFQRSDEEKEEIKRMGQLGEAFIMKDMANKDLREELRLVQKAFLSNQIELEVRNSELREKSIACAHLEERLKTAETEKQEALADVGRVKTLLDAANERVLQAKLSAVESSRDLEAHNHALTGTVSKQEKKIDALHTMLDRFSSHHLVLRNEGLQRLAFSAWSSRLAVAEESTKLMRALDSNWKARRLHDWSQAVKLQRMMQLANDCEQLQVR
jgi:hypothetical protein